MVAPGLELTCIFYLVPHEKATAITSARGLKICKPGSQLFALSRKISGYQRKSAANFFMKRQPRLPAPAA
jgi:hypothetical protein